MLFSPQETDTSGKLLRECKSPKMTGTDERTVVRKGAKGGRERASKVEQSANEMGGKCRGGL